MTEYLLHINLVIVVSILNTGLWYVFYRKVVRPLPRKRIGIGIGIGVLLFAAQVYALAATFGLHNTPAIAYYLLLLCNLVVVFTILRLPHWNAAIYGVLALFGSLVLLAITVNDYYQYFPTIQSIFVANQRRGRAATTTIMHRQRQQLATIEQTLYGQEPAHGSIASSIIPGALSHLHTRNAYIYLPPAYNDTPFRQVKFPVLVLLTGVPGTPSNWLQGGQFVSIMDKFAARHRGITPVVVIADHSGSFNNDTECVDSPHGNADTYLSKDLPAYIKQQYRVSASPRNWGIGGYSEGGMCAAMLTLKHQDTYRYFLDLSGAAYPYLNDNRQTLPVLFHGSRQAQKQSNIDWLITHQPISPDLTAQFVIGGNDSRRLILAMQKTYHLAVQRKIPASYEVVAHQGHTFAAWSRGYSDSLPTLSYYLGATSCETGCLAGSGT